MIELAGWIAPVATMIAAMMTAANLGPRITGWGFVVFTVGSIAWVTVAIGSGQANLLWANGVLTVVNLVGIWRWLGREAKYDDGARVAQAGSGRRDASTLFPITQIVGRPLIGKAGVVIGRGVGAMVECDGGRLAYLVVGAGGMGGVGERLHAIAWPDLAVRKEGFVVPLDPAGLSALPEVDAAAWPVEATPLRPASAA